MDPAIFSLDDIFCLIGTDPTDYGWAPRTPMGPQTDGLVLFGRWAVAAALVNAQLPADPRYSWQLDMRLSIRGLSVVMSEQLTEHWCPIMLSAPAGRPVPLAHPDGCGDVLEVAQRVDRLLDVVGQRAQEAAGCAAVADAMVERQRELADLAYG